MPDTIDRIEALVAKPPDEATPRVSCHTCDDSHFVVVEKAPDGKSLDRHGPCPDCEIPRRRRVRARKVGRPVPENWRGWSWDRLDVPAPALAVLKDWADYYVLMRERLAEHGHESEWAQQQDPMVGLWLTGGTGSMKTAAAAVLIQEIGQRLPTVGPEYAAFHAVDKLLNRFRHSYNDDATVTLEQLHEGLADVDLLVLDDIGAPKHTEFSVSEIYTVINSRYDLKFKPIIFTADATEVEIEEIFARAADRENVGIAAMRRWRDRSITLEFPKRDLDATRPTHETLKHAITRLNYGQTPG